MPSPDAKVLQCLFQLVSYLVSLVAYNEMTDQSRMKDNTEWCIAMTSYSRTTQSPFTLRLLDLIKLLSLRADLFMMHNDASLISSSVDDLSSGIRSYSYCIVLGRTLGLTHSFC